MKGMAKLGRAEAIITDASGVIIPKLKTLNGGQHALRRTLQLIAREAELDPKDIDKLEKRKTALLEKHKTDSVHHAIMTEFEIPLGDYAEFVFKKALPMIREEIKHDPELSQHLEDIGLPMTVLSNGLAIYVKECLRLKGVSSKFQHVITYEMLLDRVKPDKKAYKTAADFTGSEPARTIFVENKRRNLEWPAKHGFITVYIGTNEVEGTGIDFRFPTFGDFLKALKEARRETNKSEKASTE